MERVLTRWWQRAARRWPVVALLTALAATGGAVAQAASSPHHPAAHHPAVRTAQANEEAATNDAASLLASLNLPSDAVRQATEPAGDDGTLAQPVSAPAPPTRSTTTHGGSYPRRRVRSCNTSRAIRRRA